MDKVDYVGTSIRCFAAQARVNKIKDKKVPGGENEIPNLFLASAGFEAIRRISVMAYPKEIGGILLSHRLEDNTRIWRQR